MPNLVTVSKRLEALELELGFKLFSRTTRSIIPTSFAHQLILNVNEVISKLEMMRTDIGQKNETQKRKVRVTCISSMSQRFVGRLLRRYQKKNPFLDLELIVTEYIGPY